MPEKTEESKTVEHKNITLEELIEKDNTEKKIEYLINHNSSSILSTPKTFKKPKEYDTEDDIAKELLKDLKGMINGELINKNKNRNRLMWFLLSTFSVIGIATVVVVFLSAFYSYDQKIVLAMISGFFINMIGVILILVKYMFSPSKELYDYTLNIFKRKSKSTDE